MPQQPFKADIEVIRARARDKMSQGAVTGAYKADREQVLSMLNEVLATEIVCMLRYKNNAFMAKGIHAQSVAEEFMEHADQESAHADWAAERITQLGGTPNFNPDGLVKRSHAQYTDGKDLEGMIRENLIAERIAIETYLEAIRWLGDDDPTTRRLLERILEQEEEHADDLLTMLENTGPGRESM